MMSFRVCTVLLVLVCVTTTVHGVLYEVNNQGSRCKIEKVTPNTLQQALQGCAWNVNELDLSGNLLNHINAADFQKFTYLEVLNLSSNVINEAVNLQSLYNLQTIDLNNNNVQEVVVGSSIGKLLAANNNISRVECSGSAQNQRYKTIDLANNKISSLLDLIGGCRTNVEYLNLKLNEIDMVDFGHLSTSARSLKKLHLQHNFIFDLNNEGNVIFSQLDTLDLSSNKLAFMGPEFKTFPNVKSINLSNNKLVLTDNNLNISPSIEFFDLRGNGFQCETLKKLFKNNQHLQAIAKRTVLSATKKDTETCSGSAKHVKDASPFCCEDLPAPFADRLIALKRKEHALYSGQSSAQEQEECERENRERQKALVEMQKQYATKIDEETKRNQQKIQLENKKQQLERELATFQGSYDELGNEIKEAAYALSISVKEPADLLELLRSIVKQYDFLYNEEQNKQNKAIKDWEMYQQKETELLEDNERLKKVSREAEETLKKSNETLQGLIVREQQLAMFLNTTKT